ncbi:hypothetical protein [Nocardioides sp. LS1]|uniref:hypothetical protein n=1 Tax=Nocardioides sp. LS1 TaxID=1027620 RepID=UPI000FF9C4D3|nr:hypothetical protein [Nocardioides sp. LS1]GCD89355.1 hypothetical protein NLS1_13610 [Nocardioides sp. LS1]
MLVAVIAVFNTTLGLLSPSDGHVPYLFAAESAVLLVVALIRAFIEHRRLKHAAA